jgi:hypothetical protein
MWWYLDKFHMLRQCFFLVYSEPSGGCLDEFDKRDPFGLVDCDTRPAIVNKLFSKSLARKSQYAYRFLSYYNQRESDQSWFLSRHVEVSTSFVRTAGSKDYVPPYILLFIF